MPKSQLIRVLPSTYVKTCRDGREVSHLSNPQMSRLLQYSYMVNNFDLHMRQIGSGQLRRIVSFAPCHTMFRRRWGQGRHFQSWLASAYGAWKTSATQVCQAVGVLAPCIWRCV